MKHDWQRAQDSIMACEAEVERLRGAAAASGLVDPIAPYFRVGLSGDAGSAG